MKTVTRIGGKIVTRYEKTRDNFLFKSFSLFFFKFFLSFFFVESGISEEPSINFLYLCATTAFWQMEKEGGEKKKDTKEEELKLKKSPKQNRFSLKRVGKGRDKSTNPTPVPQNKEPLTQEQKYKIVRSATNVNIQKTSKNEFPNSPIIGKFKSFSKQILSETNRISFQFDF